jgi:hypothetical protein
VTADIIEDRWRARFGGPAITAMGTRCRHRRARFDSGPIDALRRSLLSVIGPGDGDRPRLSLGLRPYPGGWRARKPYLRQTTAVLDGPGAALPHYPMVLHRGGWPDGS